MDKAYITIEKEDGTEEQMEIVSAFTLNESGKNCLIYRSNSNEYFAASYDQLNDEIDLNTDFTNYEKEQIEQVFNTLYGGDNNE
jgi:uncharacterized protein YrzB (UPF0473 family)